MRPEAHARPQGPPSSGRMTCPALTPGFLPYIPFLPKPHVCCIPEAALVLSLSNLLCSPLRFQSVLEMCATTSCKGAFQPSPRAFVLDMNAVWVKMKVSLCLWWCSKVSIPVDKAIGLMEWVQSLGHDVPELQELQGLKKRCAFLFT